MLGVDRGGGEDGVAEGDDTHGVHGHKAAELVEEENLAVRGKKVIAANSFLKGNQISIRTMSSNGLTVEEIGG